MTYKLSLSAPSTIDELCEQSVESIEQNGQTQSKGTNYIQTLMNMLNGFIGSGILSMPNAFKNAGLITAAILNPIVGLLSCTCIHLLVHINREAMRAKKLSTPFTYAELGREAFLLGSDPFPKWATVGRIVVTTAIISTSFGGCCVYFVFVGTNLERFIEDITGEKKISKENCLLIMLPIIILVNSIRNLKTLSFFSVISNCCQLIGISIIYYNLLSGEQAPETVSSDKFPSFFVSTLFIFEGISVALGLFRSIDRPRDFYKPTGVLNVGLLIITIFYWSVGFFGFRKYGSATKDIITLNLPTEPLYISIRMLYTCAVTLTYPLIMYVPLSEFLPRIKAVSHRFLVSKGYKPESPAYQHRLYIIEMVFRSTLVTITYAFAAAIPNVEKMISLVGAMTSSLSAVVIPAILHMIVFWNHPSNVGLVKIGHCILVCSIVIVGLYGFIFGVIESIKDIIEFDPEADMNNIQERIESLFR